MRPRWILLVSALFLLGVAFVVAHLLVQIPTSRSADLAVSEPLPVAPVNREPQQERRTLLTPERVVAPSVVEPVAPLVDRASWAQIPLDPIGTSLGVDENKQSRMTLFNRAFSKVALKEVKNCLKDVPHEEPPDDGGHSGVSIKMALSIEGTENGFDVLDAQLIEGDLDAYRRRCLEIAMTTQVELPGSAGPPGKRYRLEFPIYQGYEKPH